MSRLTIPDWSVNMTFPLCVPTLPPTDNDIVDFARRRLLFNPDDDLVMAVALACWKAKLRRNDWGGGGTAF